VPDDAEPGAGRAVAYPGLLGEPGQGDFMTAARQAVAPRQHHLEGVVEQVNAVVLT